METLEHNQETVLNQKWIVGSNPAVVKKDKETEPFSLATWQEQEGIDDIVLGMGNKGVGESKIESSVC